MAKRYSAERVAAIIVSDSDTDEECINQSVIPEEDSDEYSPQPSSESDDEDEMMDVPEDFGAGDNVYLTRKPGFVWQKDPPNRRGRAMTANIMHARPGPTGLVPTDLESPLCAFRLIFPDSFTEMILQWTNQRYENWCMNNPNSVYSKRFGGYKPIQKTELDAFIGISIIQGSFKCSKRPVNQIFESTSPPHFRAALSRDRYQLILCFLRFDDSTTRQQRRKTDRLAPIRTLWTDFIGLCKQLYEPTECVTVDEQLVKFRGRCPFRQYLPQKPGKYGIKVWVCADSETHYCYNAEVYTGREERNKDVGFSESVVTQLVSPLYKSGRNVTMDRFFTSISLAEKLLENKLTCVGTLMSNRTGLPLALLPAAAAKRLTGSSIFAHQGKLTVVSYHPKKSKTILLLSTLHKDHAIDESGKPEIVTYYNKTKSGVDAMDQKVRHFSCYRATRRWPMVLFYNIIDIAAHNAFVLFKLRMISSEHNLKKRYDFLQQLGEELIRPMMLQRAAEPNGLKTSTISALNDFGIRVEQRTHRSSTCIPEVSTSSALVKQVCHICPRARKRKVKQRCHSCQRATCNEHSVSSLICDECSFENSTR